MASRMTHRLVACATASLVTVAGIAMPASAADRLPRLCDTEVNAAKRMGADVSELATSGIVRLDGHSVDVVGDDAQWRQDVRGNTTFVTRFHSLAWVVLAARQDFPLVDLVLARDDALADPGSSAEQDRLRATGWTQSAVRLRMGVISCLYEYTKDERLIPVMERLVLANADPFRYRGQPLNRVHNHGTLANLALIEASEVFDRPEWRDLAIRRFDQDAASVFADCGMSVEQSTNYHLLNVQLWERSLRAIAETSSEAAQIVGERIRQAELATVQLMRPDHVLEAIGDGNQVTVDPAKLGIEESASPTRLWCGGRGWAANRSSWDDTATHYTLRFGPRRTFHGHYDHGSVTWFTQGVPVFSDRGLYDKSRGERFQWAQSRQAHSTIDPTRSSAEGPSKARDLSDAAADRYRVWWEGGPLAWTRELTIPLQPRLVPSVADDTLVDDTSVVSLGDMTSDDTSVDDTVVPLAPLTSLRAQDVATARFDQQWYQNWQLAPGWTVLERTTAWEPAAVHEASGLYLYGTCRAGMDMRMTSLAVEAFPAWRTAVPATAFVCGGLGRDVRMDTLWVVTPIKGMLWRDRESADFGVTPTPAG